jgi:hypothetical protein
MGVNLTFTDREELSLDIQKGVVDIGKRTLETV